MSKFSKILMIIMLVVIICLTISWAVVLIADISISETLMNTMGISAAVALVLFFAGSFIHNRE